MRETRRGFVRQGKDSSDEEGCVEQGGDARDGDRLLKTGK